VRKDRRSGATGGNDSPFRGSTRRHNVFIMSNFAVVSRTAREMPSFSALAVSFATMPIRQSYGHRSAK
jgi:hypothetical protein